VSSIVLGAIAMAFGVLTLLARVFGWNLFSQRAAMSRQYGRRGGEAIHLVGYTIAPIVLGAVLVWSGLNPS
jgi:hypothetical protein